MTKAIYGAGQSGEFDPVYLTLADELKVLIIGGTPAEAAD
jgi:hypothetical protein